MQHQRFYFYCPDEIIPKLNNLQDNHNINIPNEIYNFIDNLNSHLIVNSENTIFNYDPDDLLIDILNRNLLLDYIAYESGKYWANEISKHPNLNNQYLKALELHGKVKILLDIRNELEIDPLEWLISELDSFDFQAYRDGLYRMLPEPGLDELEIQLLSATEFIHDYINDHLANSLFILFGEQILEYNSLDRINLFWKNYRIDLIKDLTFNRLDVFYSFLNGIYEN